MLRFLSASALLLVLGACTGTTQTDGEVKDGNWWTGGNHDATGPDDSGGGVPSGDVACATPPCTDADPADVPRQDLQPPANTPPEIEKPAPVSLDQGKATTLDLNPFISDAQDPDSALVVTWHANEVALQDPGDHILYVVAPTTWSGAEVIPLTVTDSGGLEATTDLKVIVQEVDVPEPRPPVECPETKFALDAGKQAKEVLLSGNFNNWSADAGTAKVMTDLDADGVFEASLDLAPGTYQYKFIVDGKWLTDPQNPDRVDDGYGGKNSVVSVPECEE